MSILPIHGLGKVLFSNLLTRLSCVFSWAGGLVIYTVAYDFGVRGLCHYKYNQNKLSDRLTKSREGYIAIKKTVPYITLLYDKTK